MTTSRLKLAFLSGVNTAFARYKIAIPVNSPGLGADYGVAPSGREMSHGTDRIPQEKDRGNADPAQSLTQDQYNADWLWDNQKLDHMAPGYQGEWGQEVVG